jgi:chemosensory pili system protein ChpA (sensor histidine kinase/response regulator)
MLIGTKHSGYSRANIRLYFDPVTIMAAGATEAAALTAAEIAAAEAAAAAAAEAAAVTAAEATAAQAAQAAAAEAATTAAATAANAAPAFNPAGIMEIGGTTAPGAAPLTSEAVQTAAMQAGQNVPYQFSPAELDAMAQGQEIARASSAAPPLETTAGFNLKGTMLENTFLNQQ